MSQVATEHRSGATPDHQGIVVQGLTKYYGDHCVFKDISFEIGPTEIVSVVGPSGCGKTTLLRCLNGLIHADEGSVLVDGDLVSKPRPEIAIVFQDFGLFPWKTALDNVAYGLTVRGTPKKKARETARDFVKLVALDGFEERYRTNSLVACSSVPALRERWRSNPGYSSWTSRSALSMRRRAN